MAFYDFLDVLIVLFIVLVFGWCVKQYQLSEYYKTPLGAFEKYFYIGKVPKRSDGSCGFKPGKVFTDTNPVHMRDIYTIEMLRYRCNTTTCAAGTYVTDTVDIRFSESYFANLPDRIPILKTDTDILYIDKTSIADSRKFYYSINIRMFLDDVGLTCDDFK